ncbi:MAG: MerR family DNA-binding protein, partial [Pseudomonadota bacterium]
RAPRNTEWRGLIQSIGRRGLRRVFGNDVRVRLCLIALGQAAGFSLDEIREIFTSGENLEINRQKLLAKAEELDEKIERLKTIRDGLRSTADCPAPSHLECPNFLRVLDAAGKGLIPPLLDQVRTEALSSKVKA